MQLISERKIGFTYFLECLRPDGTIRWRERIDNIIPNEGIAYMMSAAYLGGAQLTTWYIGLYKGEHTPVVTDTMATLLAAATESTDYSGGARKTLNGALANGVYSNINNPADFVFTAGVTIRGGFITNNSIFNNSSGILVSAVKFSTARVMATGETLRVKAGNALVTA